MAETTPDRVPDACAPPWRAASPVAARCGPVPSASRHRGPGGLRQRGHGRDRRPSAATPSRRRSGPERHREGRQLVELDRVHRRRPTTRSRARPSTPSPSRPASRSTTPRTTTTTTSSTPRCARCSRAARTPAATCWCSTDWMVARLSARATCRSSTPPTSRTRSNLEPRSRTSSSTRAALLPPVAERLRRHRATTSKATGGKKVESIDPAAHRPGPQGQGHPAHRDARHRRPRAVEHGQGPGTSPTPTSTPPSTCSRRPRTPARSCGFTGNDYTDGLDQGRHRRVRRLDR